MIYRLMILSCSFMAPLLCLGATYLHTTGTAHSDSTGVFKSLQVVNHDTGLPLTGAVCRLSDSKRHGILIRYQADSEGRIQFEINEDQRYFIQVKAPGFESFEEKMSATELKNLNCLPLMAKHCSKKAKFDVSKKISRHLPFTVPEPFHQNQCWMYPPVSWVVKGITDFRHAKWAAIQHLSYITF